MCITQFRRYPVICQGRMQHPLPHDKIRYDLINVNPSLSLSLSFSTSRCS